MRQKSQWGAGNGPYGIGFAVYRDGQMIDWGHCHPVSFWGAKLAARRFAWRERRGKRVPPYHKGLRVVVADSTIPRTDLRVVR